MAFKGFLKKSSSSSGSRMAIPEDPALPKVIDSGRFAGYSHDDLDSFRPMTAGGCSAELVDPAISARVEEHYVSNSLVSRRLHLIDRRTMRARRFRLQGSKRRGSELVSVGTSPLIFR